MANKARIQELKTKVTALVDRKYGGDWDRMFAHYASMGGCASLVGRDELVRMLEDAGIGDWLTRGAWADGIIKELDVNANNQLSRNELSELQR